MSEDKAMARLSIAVEPGILRSSEADAESGDSETLQDKQEAGMLAGAALGGTVGFLFAPVLGGFIGSALGAMIGRVAMPRLTS